MAPAALGEAGHRRVSRTTPRPAKASNKLFCIPNWVLVSAQLDHSSCLPALGEEENPKP